MRAATFTLLSAATIGALLGSWPAAWIAGAILTMGALALDIRRHP